MQPQEQKFFQGVVTLGYLFPQKCVLRNVFTLIRGNVNISYGLYVDQVMLNHSLTIHQHLNIDAKMYKYISKSKEISWVMAKNGQNQVQCFKIDLTLHCFDLKQKKSFIYKFCGCRSTKVEHRGAGHFLSKLGMIRVHRILHFHQSS